MTRGKNRMKKKLQYNEYGANIQQNPKWCDLISWILYKISGAFYPLYRHKHQFLYIWFQAEAYSWGDIQCYARVKGYKS